MNKPLIIGIDLGTSYSLVAAMQGGRPVLLPNALGEILTPSAVSMQGTTVLVGAPARARSVTHPALTVRSFKRDMGTARTYHLGQRTFTPQELSAILLNTLKQDAEAALGQSVEEAIITVPAYFGDAQRQATRDAGAIAGLKVERIINEPTAAALAYGLHHRDRELRAIVIDLGGGTFDVTLLEIVAGVIEIQASAGDARLGGDDFADAMAELAARRIVRQYGFDAKTQAAAWARLVEASEAAKIALTEAQVATLALPGLPRPDGTELHVELSVSRDEAEEAWTPLIERMRGPIRRALGDAGVNAADVDEVLLVGGATRMPCVVRAVAQIFGKLPLRTLPPDEAVAMGAAVQAGLKAADASLGDLVATDIAPFTIGVASAAEVGGQRIPGVFTPILHRGTVIPASRVKRFSPIADLQTEVDIEVYQGEHSMCRDNTKLGDYRVTGIKPKPAGEEWFDVRFTYDLNGILEVDTTVGSTGRTHTLVIERSPGRLSKEQIAAAQARMKRLKLHPRDSLPNATALARADALYVELSGPAREVLGEVIVAFRAALESQDASAIEPMRARLVAVVRQLRSRNG